MRRVQGGSGGDGGGAKGAERADSVGGEAGEGGSQGVDMAESRSYSRCEGSYKGPFSGMPPSERYEEWLLCGVPRKVVFLLVGFHSFFANLAIQLTIMSERP